MIGRLKVGYNWVVLEVDHEIGRYYRKLFLRTFGIKLERPSNKEHITVVSPYDFTYYTRLLLPYHDSIIKFRLDNIVYTNGNAFWLNVNSEQLEKFRVLLGGIYEQDLHFCIGYLNGSTAQN